MPTSIKAAASFSTLKKYVRGSQDRPGLLHPYDCIGYRPLP